MTEENTRHDGSETARSGGWLWISAGVLAALTLVQGAGLLDRTARAEMVSEKSGYAIMTTDGGTDQILVVLDERNEMLMVYSVENRREMILQDRQPIPDMFVQARTQSGARRRP